MNTRTERPGYLPNCPSASLHSHSLTHNLSCNTLRLPCSNLSTTSRTIDPWTNKHWTNNKKKGQRWSLTIMIVSSTLFVWCNMGLDIAISHCPTIRCQTCRFRVLQTDQWVETQEKLKLTLMASSLPPALRIHHQHLDQRYQPLGAWADWSFRDSDQ